MFKQFDPLKDRQLQVMDENGAIVNDEWKPDISDEAILEAYKFMNFTRVADQMAVSFQRQGRMYTYPPNLGQEAIHAAAGHVMQSDDWLVPAFRELGAWLLKGARLRDIFLYWGGYEDGVKFSDAANFLPPSVPIASQVPHAVGIGYGLKIRKKDGVVFVFLGDGGTSQGDFHEALNFAGVWKVPVVVVIQNNQYAISVPVREQTASKNLAMKAVAYGIPGIKVDGNDYLAMMAALAKARDHASRGKGAVVIEGHTFRIGAHTTSDDPSLYRSEEEEKAWSVRDPIHRLRKYLISKKIWQEKEDGPLLEQFKKEVDKEFSIYESHPPYQLDDVFNYHFEELPADLKNQKASYEKYQNWKETQT